jgi:hypothetical protein
MKKIASTIVFYVAVLVGAAQNTTFSCDAPTGLHASDVGLDYITIDWDDDPNVSAWQVWLYPHDYGGGSPNGGTVTDTNTFTMPYIFIVYDDSPNHPGTSPLYYDFAVRADCGDSTWGPWSNVITVATAYVGIVERLKNSITVFPNPATSFVDVRVDGDVNVTGMEVYDVYGKILRTVVETRHGTSLQTRIDVSDLSSGMYFVRASTDHGPITKPFVKK